MLKELQALQTGITPVKKFDFYKIIRCTAVVSQLTKLLKYLILHYKHAVSKVEE